MVCDAPIEQAVREQFKLQGAYFLSAAEADQLAKVVATPQRSLNPAIVGKSVEVIAKMAGLSVPPGTRCLMAEVGGVGRDYPLSMEKLSPALAVNVELTDRQKLRFSASQTLARPEYRERSGIAYRDRYGNHQRRRHGG